MAGVEKLPSGLKTTRSGENYQITETLGVGGGSFIHLIRQFMLIKPLP